MSNKDKNSQDTIYENDNKIVSTVLTLKASENLVKEIIDDLQVSDPEDAQQVIKKMVINER